MSDLTDRLLAVEGSREGTHWYRNPDGPEAAAEIDRLQARVAVLTEALTELLHAVCGETGFAECVRTHANVAYPWPALDIAEERVRAALSEPPTGEKP